MIPIIYSTDNNYVPYVYCSIKSLSAHTAQDNEYHIYVLHTDLSAENRKHLQSLQKENLQIEFVNAAKILAGYDRNIFGLSYHFTIETYYRFFLPELFPELDKVLYLDGDTLVNRDVAGLWAVDIGDCYLGATRDCEIIKQLQLQGKDYADYFTNVLRLENPHNYFQAGVMLVNLCQWRQNNVTQKLLDCLKKVKTPRFVDQDILNAVCQNKVCFIPQNWDYTWHIPLLDEDYLHRIPVPYNRQYESARQEPYIIHFTGENCKPVDFPNPPEAKLFWQYAGDSPYYNELLCKADLCRKKHCRKIRKLKWQIFKYTILLHLFSGSLREKYCHKCKQKKHNLKWWLKNNR